MVRTEAVMNSPYYVGNKERNALYVFETRVVTTLRKLADREEFADAEFADAYRTCVDYARAKVIPNLVKAGYIEYLRSEGPKGAKRFFRITDAGRALKLYDERLDENMRAAFPVGKRFTAKEAIDALGCSGRVMRNKLSELRNSGELTASADARYNGMTGVYYFNGKVSAPKDETQEDSAFLGKTVGKGVKTYDDAIEVLRRIVKERGTDARFTCSDYIKILGTDCLSTGQYQLDMLVRDGCVAVKGFSWSTKKREYALTEKGLNLKTLSERLENALIKAYGEVGRFRPEDAKRKIGVEINFLRKTINELVERKTIRRIRRKTDVGFFYGYEFCKPKDEDVKRGETGKSEFYVGKCPSGALGAVETPAILSLRECLRRKKSSFAVFSARDIGDAFGGPETSNQTACQFAGILLKQGYAEQIGPKREKAGTLYRATPKGLSVKTYEERVLDALDAAYGQGKFFRVQDVCETIGTERVRTNRLINRLFDQEKLTRVSYVALDNSKIHHYYYSFNKDATVDDLYEQLGDKESDPIPFDERTAEPQLFGEELERYLQCKEARENQQLQEVGIKVKRDHCGRPTAQEDEERPEYRAPDAETACAFCRSHRRVSFGRLLRFVKTNSKVQNMRKATL